MAALWDVATIEERYEMVTIVLEPGGLYYDLENKVIAAIKPRPAFLPVLRMLNGVMEFDETRGLLVTEHWCDRNRRESGYPQEVRVTAKYVGPRVQQCLSVFYGSRECDATSWRCRMGGGCRRRGERADSP